MIKRTKGDCQPNMKEFYEHIYVFAFFAGIILLIGGLNLVFDLLGLSDLLKPNSDQKFKIIVFKTIVILMVVLEVFANICWVLIL